MDSETYVKEVSLEVVENDKHKKVPIEKDTYISHSSLLYHYNYTDIPYVSEEDLESY